MAAVLSLTAMAKFLSNPEVRPESPGGLLVFDLPSVR
jgi:hypothetical protein